MKTLRRLQNLAIVIGAITAIAIADGQEATSKELFAAFMLGVLIVITICYQQVSEERRNQK